MAAIKRMLLPENMIRYLVKLPESGMGYQLVKVFLKTGEVLRQHKVLNSEMLILEEGEDISAADIFKIEMEQE